ncbi:hypothetical protein J1N35_029705 [Gossypium stocksii]|uniref:Uncharacterized protein n=1 Tax=Gossypium stocksii TaxID=47602 RepID=A0A9D3ZTB0_9ROSI|nr:hypothetical protein J1N35_029705 [Gossypium stocksii]
MWLCMLEAMIGTRRSHSLTNQVWTPSKEGWVKFNSDGSMRGEGSTTARGCSRFLGTCNELDAELWRLGTECDSIEAMQLVNTVHEGKSSIRYMRDIKSPCE